jgi:hypothetical protein
VFVTLLPCITVLDPPLLNEKSKVAGAVTVSVNIAVLVKPPPVPVTVIT